MYNLKPIKLAQYGELKPLIPIKKSKKKKSGITIKPISMQLTPMPSTLPKKKRKGKTDYSYQEKIDTSYIDRSYENKFIPKDQFFNPFQTKLTSFKPMNFSKGFHSFDTRRRVKPIQKKYTNHRDMSYSDAWNMYRLKPFGDIDRDGVPNWRDCKPYDETRDGKILDAVKSKVKTTFKRNKKTPMNDEVEVWEDSKPVREPEVLPPGGVWEATTPDKPNPNNAYKTAYPEVWEEGEEWDEDRTNQETSLVPVEEQPGVEYGGPVVPYEDKTPKRTDEIVPYGETSVDKPLPHYINYVEVEDEIVQPPMKQVGYYQSADEEFPDTEDAVDGSVGIKDRLSGAYEGMKKKGGEIKEKLKRPEEEHDGQIRIYYRQLKGKWRVYQQSFPPQMQEEAFKTLHKIESEAYIAEVFMDDQLPPERMLQRLNARLQRERFVGEIKDISEKTVKGVKKIDKDEAKALRRSAKSWGDSGPPNPRSVARQYYRALGLDPSKQTSAKNWQPKRGYDLGLGSTRTPYSGGYQAPMGKPRTPNRSWWDVAQGRDSGNRGRRQSFPSRDRDFSGQYYAGQNDMYETYDYENSPRTVPPNMFGNGRVDRYNPVTAQQSFVGAPRKPQRPQRFEGFQNENRPRGLGMTGGQRRLYGNNE